jgi:hypothetical protein
MIKRNDVFFYVMAMLLGATVSFILPDWFRQGTLVLRPAACVLVKSAGATPVEIEIGCTLEGKYDIGRSFTEIRLPNKKKLLISNSEISGSIEN